MKVTDLVKDFKRRELACSFKTSGDLLRTTYCDKETPYAPFHPISCILRDCVHCGENRLTIGHPVSITVHILMWNVSIFVYIRP